MAEDGVLELQGSDRGTRAAIRMRLPVEAARVVRRSGSVLPSGPTRAVGTPLDLGAFCISAGPEVVVSSFIPIHLQSGVAALGPVPTSSQRRRASSCRCPY